MTNILRSFNNLDNNFINSYKKKNGFWYSFKRSINDLENLFIIFKYFESYEGKNWFKNQEELSIKLIKAHLLNPSKEKLNASANVRGLKKVFELLGFCFVDHDEKLNITETGAKFLKTEDNQKRYEIKTKQLLKYQINNPLVKVSKYKEMHIKPFVFLLELLSKLKNQSINSTEYKLFVSRAHNHNDLQDVIDQINYWRTIDEDSKNLIINKVKKSEIYRKISGYNAYSMIFFGQSKYTQVSSFEDEKII